MTSAAGRELQTMSLAVNYHRWMYSVAEPYLGQRIVEVGGGIGNFSHLLEDRQRLVILDNDPAAIGRLRERFGTQEHIRILDGDIVDPQIAADLAREAPDTVISMNVFEHIEDDRAALRNSYQALRPGGHLILLVPAHPRLYGTLDERLQHIRRYDRKGLTDKMRQANFRMCRCIYFNSLGVAGWYLASRVRRQERIGEGQIRLYDRCIVPFLSRAERLFPPPFGQSLIAIGRK